MSFPLCYRILCAISSICCSFCLALRWGLAILFIIILITISVSKRSWQVNYFYHCGKGDQMASPSMDFLNPLPCPHLCILFNKFA